jgi:hypothetical protein
MDGGLYDRDRAEAIEGAVTPRAAHRRGESRGVALWKVRSASHRPDSSATRRDVRHGSLSRTLAARVSSRLARVCRDALPLLLSVRHPQSFLPATRPHDKVRSTLNISAFGSPPLCGTATARRALVRHVRVRRGGWTRDLSHHDVSARLLNGELAEISARQIGVRRRQRQRSCGRALLGRASAERFNTARSTARERVSTDHATLDARRESLHAAGLGRPAGRAFKR